MRAGSCVVCRNARRAEIDQASLAGATVRDLAAKFDRSPTTIQRHVTEHIPASTQKAIEARELDAGESVLETMADLAVIAKRLLKAAEDKKDYRTAIAGLRELTRLTELRAKVLGEIHDNQVNVNVHLDDATLLKMARTFADRRSKPAIITVQAKPAEGQPATAHYMRRQSAPRRPDLP